MCDKVWAQQEGMDTTQGCFHLVRQRRNSVLFYLQIYLSGPASSKERLQNIHWIVSLHVVLARLWLIVMVKE